MKGKKGQAIMVGVMIFIVLFIVVTVFIGPMKDQINLTRTELDCDNSTITSGQKSTCIVNDFSLFYFVGMSIAAAASFLGGKFVKSRQ